MRAGVGEQLRLTAHERLEVRESSTDLLEVEATWDAEGGKPPPPHFHPAQDEHFEVLEGALHADVDGERCELRAGDTLEVPRGTKHRMWNPGPGVARARWQTRPRARTEEWFRAIDGLHRDGRVDAHGRPKPLDFLKLAAQYGDTMRLSVGPAPLVDGALAVLRVAGRVGRRS